MIKAYDYATISFVDVQVGRMLQAPETAGQLDNTLVVFTSDHGELLGDYQCFGKRSMHDASWRVPLLARLPGRFAAGARCSRAASLVDVYATVLAACGEREAVAQADGHDLTEVAAGTSERVWVLSQFDRGGLTSRQATGARPRRPRTPFARSPTPSGRRTGRAPDPGAAGT